MKTEVYSWRVSSSTKKTLEQEARREGVTIARLLDRITREWIESRRAAGGNDAEQKRLHRAARRSFATIHGGNPQRAGQSREIVRERLRSRHGR